MVGFSFLRRLLTITPLVVISLIATSTAQQQFPCARPAEGCENGLWSSSNCQCECIPPFCRNTIGACAGAGYCDDTNPWLDCTRGVDCPWWDNPKKLERCTTGPSVPPGIWDIYASRKICCDIQHSYSFVCNPEILDSPPTKHPTPASYEDKYELVPIKFTVSSLPREVNMRELKAEMMLVLRRILTDLAKRVQYLKITNVEENLVLTVIPQDDSDANDGDDSQQQQDTNDAHGDPNNKEFYYDVSVLRHPNKQFGPIIIAGLRDSYDVFIEEIEHYTNMKYFGYGIDFIWCTNNNNAEKSFGMCSLTDEKVTVQFRLANIPQELDMEKLIGQMILIYKDVLKGVERLDILDIEKKVVNLSSDGEGNDTKDIFFDIRLVPKFDIPDFGPAINDQLQGSKNGILDRIQSYIDTETDLGLNWYINDEGAYVVSPEAEEESPFGLPIWASITLTVVSVVLLCCLCYCSMAYIKKRDKDKNERNMASYIRSGQNYSKRKKPTRQSRQPPRQRKRHRIDSRPMPQSHRPRGSRHKQYRMPTNRRDTRSIGDSQDEEYVQTSKDTEYQLENMSSFVFDNSGDGNRPPDSHDEVYVHTSRPAPQHPMPRKDTKYQLKNTPSFAFDNSGDGNRPLDSHDEVYVQTSRLAPQHPMPRKDTDTEYQLEYMPSFIFDNGGDGNNPSQMVRSVLSRI